MNLESTSEVRTSKFISTGQPFTVSSRRATSSSSTCPHGLFTSSQRARSRGRRLFRSFAGFCISRRELGLGSYSLRRDFPAASRRGSHETARHVPRRARRRRGRVGPHPQTRRARSSGCVPSSAQLRCRRAPFGDDEVLEQHAEALGLHRLRVEYQEVIAEGALLLVTNQVALQHLL